MDNLLTSAVEMILGNNGIVEAPHESELPEAKHFDTIQLDKPGDALKAVRKRLNELREQDQAELKAKKAKLQEELAEERRIAELGHFDLAEEIAKNTSREALAKMRADGDIAEGIIRLKEDEIDVVNDQISDVARRWHTKSQQVLQGLQSLEVAHRRYLQAFATGNFQDIRMNPERQERAFYRIITLEETLRKHLDDDALVDAVMDEVTTFPVPDRYQDLLWQLMTPKARTRFQNEYDNYKKEQ